MIQPESDRSPDASDIHQALISRISKTTPDETSVLTKLHAGRVRRRTRRVWISAVAVAAATATVAIIPSLPREQSTASSIATTTVAVSSSTKGSVSSRSPVSAQQSRRSVSTVAFAQEPLNPAVCSHPAQSATVALARYGSSPPIPLGSTRPSQSVDQNSDNVMYTVDGAPGAGTLCVRSGRITTATNLFSNTKLLYLLRMNLTDAYSYGGSFGPGVGRVEISAASPDSPLTDTYIGSPKPVTNLLQSMRSQDLGGGWYSFNLPVYSPTWHALLRVYDLSGDVVMEVSLP